MCFFTRLCSLGIAITIILLESSLSIAYQPSYLSYTPPPENNNNASGQRTTTSTSRGCNEKEPPITVVIPPQQIATTAKNHPTFLLYIPGTPSRPIKISVTEPNVTESIFETELTVTKSGFHSVSVPTSRQGLESLKTYVLTVGMLCNPRRPSQSAYTRISFKKVEIDFKTKRRLESAKSELERAQIYEKAGIWYDAIASAYKSKQNSDPQAISYFNHLIEEAQISFPPADAR
jgi:Domain of Unknown Function (DUF928)